MLSNATGLDELSKDISIKLKAHAYRLKLCKNIKNNQTEIENSSSVRIIKNFV